MGCQAPLFISFFFATRRLAEDSSEVAAESLFWLPSLAEADPFYVLPLICSCSLLLLAELGGDPSGGEAQQEQMKMMKNIMRVVAVAVLPMTASMPALTFTYWLSANFFSAFQIPSMRQVISTAMCTVALL